MKKQIAVLMAAATAVTTVAPVIANADIKEHKDVSVAEVSKKVKEALDTRYANKNENGLDSASVNPVDDYMNSRYAVMLETDANIASEDLEKYGLEKLKGHEYESILNKDDAKKIASNLQKMKEEAQKNGASVEAISKIKREYYAALKRYNHLLNETVYVIKDSEKVNPLLEKIIATPRKDGSFMTDVLIVDKGIEGNSQYRTTKYKHLVKNVKNSKTEYSYYKLLNDFVKLENAKVTFVDKVEKFSDMFKVTLKNGNTLDFHVNDDAIDIMKAMTKDGEDLDLSIDKDTLVINNAQTVADKVAKFALIDNEDNLEEKVDVINGDMYVYSIGDMDLSTIEIGNIYTKENGYTKDGADLVNSLIKAKNGVNGKYTFNYGGVNYVLAKSDRKQVTNSIEAKAAIMTETDEIAAVGDAYTLRLNVRVIDKNDRSRFKTLQFKFEGKNQKDLARVLYDLKGNKEVVVGKFTKLAGANRFETAIQVSQERFGYGDADTVVIVGSEALMDGLSAAPLAAAKNAPVLLADAKTGLNDATMNEIARATKDLNRKTVYIVGGSHSVPRSVDSQLMKKFGAVVVRLAGDDRYDTSLEVASRLETDHHIDRTLYVVGGEGAADAMSISAVAARKNNKVSPILVSPKSGVKKIARKFINDMKNDKKFNQVYLIGGENSVSTQVYRDLEQIVATTPVNNNVATDRVERVSGRDRYATNVAVIKKFNMMNLEGLDITSGDNKYLVDAQTAGAFAAENNAAILLTGSSLTKDQKDLLGDVKLKTGIYQVGGVVASNVMKEVVDILGL